MDSLISLFSIGFYVFLVIAVIGIGLGVFTFIKFRIPEVVSLMTGNAQRKSVEQMKATGIMRSEAEMENDRTAAGLNGTERMHTEDYMTQEIGPQAAAGYAQAVSDPSGTQETSVLGAAVETTILGGAAETTVLGDVQETTILEPAQETMPLQQDAAASESAGRQIYPEPAYNNYPQPDDDPETAVLGNPGIEWNGETQELKGYSNAAPAQSDTKAGETVVLDRNAPRAPEVSFECIEHVMITHTDEVI